MLSEKLQHKLEEILPNKVFSSSEILKSHTSNQFYITGQGPDVVCYAESKEDVIAVTNFCIQNKIPLIPYGSGTSVEGHTLIQEFIYHFAFDLKYNNKIASITKSSPIGYFMGILKRSAVYTAPDNYESPKDRALRELFERKKAEKARRDIMIKEIINMAFDDWQAKLSQEEKEQLIPEEIKKSRLTGAKLASLKAYFIENVWPQVMPKEII